MHLRYSYMTASIDCGENRHAQTVMKELGITYSHSTPQSISDSFWFWNCQNVPAELPKYLCELNVKPHDAIGCGLSQKQAEEIEQAANAALTRGAQEIDTKRGA